MCCILCFSDTNSICAEIAVLHICKNTCQLALVFLFAQFHLELELDMNYCWLLTAFLPFPSILFDIQTFPSSCPFLQKSQTTNIYVNCQLLSLTHRSSWGVEAPVEMSTFSMYIFDSVQPTSVRQPGNVLYFGMWFMKRCQVEKLVIKTHINYLLVHHAIIHKLSTWIVCHEGIHSNFAF